MEKKTTRPGRLYVKRHRGQWRRSVFSLLEEAGLETAIKDRKRILIKPNLVEAMAPPVTTPVGLVEAIADFVLEKAPGAEVIVGDGTGSLDYDTRRCFSELGYMELAGRRPVRLVDLNTEPLVRLSNPGLTAWPEMYLPGLVFDSFLISVPVLKAHTLADVTLTMKNMFGLAPPEHYQMGGHWKKSGFHSRIHESILDLNSYRTPDFTVLDATVGMKEAHLWGPTISPGLLIAGFDPVAVDAFGADMLGKDYNRIRHIAGASGILGFAEPLGVERI